MMEENIFDTAGKFDRLKKDKTSNEKSSQDPVKKNDTQVQVNPVINEMLQKMRDMKLDLELQLADVYQKGKDSKVDVSILVDNANNLTRMQLKQMEEQEKLLTDKIKAAIPPESCLKKNPKSKEKLTQERQGKMRGARNNWIPVR